MSFKLDLIQFLLAEASITGVVGSRIYWGNATQDAGTPYIVLSTQSGNGDRNMKTAEDRKNLSIQIDVYALRWMETDVARSAIIALLDGRKGDMNNVAVDAIFYQGESEEYDDKDKLFRLSLDFDFHFQEPSN